MTSGRREREEMEININEILSMIIQLVIVPAIIYGMTLLRKWLLTKTKAVQVDTVIMMADETIRGAVATVSQTFVDQLKLTGQWTPDRYKEAAEMAYTMAVKSMSADTMAILREVTGSTNQWIQQKIEEVVREDRMIAKSATSEPQIHVIPETPES